MPEMKQCILWHVRVCARKHSASVSCTVVTTMVATTMVVTIMVVTVPKELE